MLQNMELAKATPQYRKKNGFVSTLFGAVRKYRRKIYIVTSDIDWNCPLTIDYDEALTDEHLCAKVPDVDGIYVYYPSLGHCFKTLGDHHLEVTFIPTDLKYYKKIQCEIVINVIRATPVIDWPIRPWVCAGVIPTSYFNARYMHDDLCGTFEYTPTESDVLILGEYIFTCKFTSDEKCLSTYIEEVTIRKKVTVVNKKVPVIKWSIPTSTIIYCRTPLSAEHHLNATCDISGVFTYTESVGDTLPIGKKELKVTFRPNDIYDYTQAYASVVVDVHSLVTPEIIWKPAIIRYGEQLSLMHLNAYCTSEIDPSGVFIYHSNNSIGRVYNIVQEEALEVKYTPVDTTKYTIIVLQIKVMIMKAIPTISWSLGEQKAYEGEQLDYAAYLNATVVPACASDSLRGSFYYTPSVGFRLKRGPPQQITATFITDNDCREHYEDTSKLTLSLTISLKTYPVITWQSIHKDVYYTTPLSVDQYNQSCDVEGTYEYEPAIGSILDVGTHEILVRFIAHHRSRYYVVTATSTITVLEQHKPFLSWVPVINTITYGTKLSEDQLCTRCFAKQYYCTIDKMDKDITYEFVYNPVMGTILDVGKEHVLQALCYPNTNALQTCEITAVIKVKKAEPNISWVYASSIKLFEGSALKLGVHLTAKAIAATDGDELHGSFTYTPPAGTKLSEGRNVLSVSFKTDKECQDRYLKEGTASITLQVYPRKVVTLDWENPDDIMYGTPLSIKQLNARRSDDLDCSGSIKYDPSVGRILDAVEHRWLRATFIPDNHVEVASVTKEVYINVVKATATISWAKPASIYAHNKIDKDLHYSIRIVEDSLQDGRFEYDPDIGTVMPQVGEVVLKATYYPSKKKSKSYNDTVFTSYLTVLPKIYPTVTWVATHIEYGTLISSEQLNATCGNAEGLFTYDTAIDTLLPTGEYTLSATFAPFDTSIYYDMSVTTTLVVKKATPIIAWRNPKRIYDDVPLTSKELNAKVVSKHMNNKDGGRWIYRPDYGEYLDAGIHSLYVFYEPAVEDQDNFHITSFYIDNVKVVIRNKPSNVVVLKETPRTVSTDPRNCLIKPPEPSDFSYTQFVTN